MGVKIQKKVLDEMRDLGARVQKLKGEGLFSVTKIVYGDRAWKVYEDWANTVNAELKVGAIFACPEEFIFNDLAYKIQVEASSIVFHYASKTIGDLVDDIPGPILAPRPYYMVNSKFALSKLMKRILEYSDNYPAIASLYTGAYICTINYQWANAGVVVELYK